MADNINRRGRESSVPNRDRENEVKGYRDYSSAAQPIRTESSPSTFEAIESRIENIYYNIEDLVTTQVELARTEISEKMDQVKKGATELTTGGIMMLFGGQALTFTAILILNFWMDLWIAALVVGVVMAGIGAALLAAGKKNLQPDNLMPERTMRSVKKDAQAMRDNPSMRERR